MPHNIFSHFHFLRSRELNELYASIAIRAFAISLVGIFVPIFLYQLNYSFSQIFLFFGMIAFFNMIFLFPSAKFASKYGLKHGMLLSMPFLIIFFLLLFSLENLRWPLYFMAIFGGAHGALFWISYHTDFSKFSKKKSRGSEVGFSKNSCISLRSHGAHSGSFGFNFFWI